MQYSLSTAITTILFASSLTLAGPMRGGVATVQFSGNSEKAVQEQIKVNGMPQAINNAIGIKSAEVVEAPGRVRCLAFDDNDKQLAAFGKKETTLVTDDGTVDVAKVACMPAGHARGGPTATIKGAHNPLATGGGSGSKGKASKSRFSEPVTAPGPEATGPSKNVHQGGRETLTHGHGTEKSSESGVGPTPTPPTPKSSSTGKNDNLHLSSIETAPGPEATGPFASHSSSKGEDRKLSFSDSKTAPGPEPTGPSAKSFANGEGDESSN